MYRTVSHNFGCIYSSTKYKDFLFIPISKCASSSIINTFSLNKIEYLETIPNYINKKFICVIRNPVERFISSIPETLHRVRSCRDRYNCNLYEDVVIDELIFNLLKNLNSNEIYYPNLFLDLIDEYGFFDAHHESYKSFLYEFDKKRILKNIHFVDFNSINKYFFDNYGKRISKINNRNEIHKWYKLKNIKTFKPVLISKENVLINSNFTFLDYKVLTKKNMNNQLNIFYNSLKNNLQRINIKKFKKIYKFDIDLYNSI